MPDTTETNGGEPGGAGGSGGLGSPGKAGAGGQGGPGGSGGTGGAGIKGDKGDKGEDSKDNRGRAIAIWIFLMAVVIVLIVMGLRVTNLAIQANNNSHQLRVDRYHQCVGSVGFIEKYNEQQISLEELVPGYDGETIPEQNCEALNPDK